MTARKRRPRPRISPARRKRAAAARNPPRRSAPARRARRNPEGSSPQFRWHRKPAGDGVLCSVCGVASARLKAQHRALTADEMMETRGSRGRRYVKHIKTAFGADSEVEFIDEDGPRRNPAPMASTMKRAAARGISRAAKSPSVAKHDRELGQRLRRALVGLAPVPRYEVLRLLSDMGQPARPMPRASDEKPSDWLYLARDYEQKHGTYTLAHSLTLIAAAQSKHESPDFVPASTHALLMEIEQQRRRERPYGNPARKRRARARR